MMTTQLQPSDIINKEPLPCPFCGSTSIMFGEGSTHRWMYCGCASCGANTGDVRKMDYGKPADDPVNRRDALDVWNSRYIRPGV